MQTIRGQVISYFGNSVAVEAEDGQVFPCHLRRNQALPVVGDWVQWIYEGENQGIIQSIEPRSSLLFRGDARGKTKSIAANVDIMMIVMAPSPIFSEYLVDRYLVAAEILNIKPILVINKIDLLDEESKQKLSTSLQSYYKIPYSVLLTSIYKSESLSDISLALQDKTAVLVGPSGVGKSSLISILSKDEIRTKAVSPKGAGKHTTTATRLYHLPYGGQLIDSPGVREFNLWPVEPSEILRGFKEFQPYLSGCKFRDCQHLVEPGCGVQEAVKNGKVSEQRYTSFQALIREANERQKNKYE